MPDVALTVDGRAVRVPAGTIVAAAIVLNGVDVFRRSVDSDPRAPLCGMGICFECRVTIDGEAHRLSCQTVCEDGMQVLTQ